MNRAALLPLSLLGAALALGALSVGTAAADAPPAHSPTWAFDVKVVMVHGSRPELAEEPPVFATDDPHAPVVKRPWSELLGILKARGETTVLLDSMTTTHVGTKAEIEQNRARIEDVYERRDMHNEYRKASTLNEGVKAMLLPTGRSLEYEAMVSWLHPAQAKGALPFQGRWRVRGTWTALDRGPTLVLSHREQIREAGHAPVDLELYAFVTWRTFR